MKKGIAILLLFLLCLQVIPVAQLFASDDALYAWVDEDRPEESKQYGKVKKESKEYFTGFLSIGTSTHVFRNYPRNNMRVLPWPLLDQLTQPPNC